MLADLATRAGRPVAAFDLFGDLDLQLSARRVVTGGSLSGLVDAAVTEPAGRVVYGASFENHPALVARLGERHVILGNPPGALRAVRDPAKVGAALHDAGLPYPHTSGSAPPDPSCRWLRKPLRGGGGTRVRAWRGGGLRAGEFVQERIDGLACSAAAVGDGADAAVLGVCEQLVGQRAFGVRGYRWCGNLVPPRLPAAERDALLAQARAICSCLTGAFALRGLFGVDLVWDGGRAWVVEVNPRPTASLETIEAVHGVGTRPDRLRSGGPTPLRGLDPFAAHLEACAGRLRAVSPPADPSRAAGKAVVFARRDVRVPDTRDWTARGIRDVPHPGEPIAAGHPICTLLTAGRSPEAVLADLEARAGALYGELHERVPVHAVA